MNAATLGTVGVCLSFLCGIALGQDDSAATPEKSATRPAVLIIPLEHVPATDIATSLQQFIGENRDIRIVPLTLSNSLLVGGVQGEDAGFLRDLVGMVDRKPAAVDIDVAIIQTAADSETKTLGLSGNASEVASNIDALQKAGTLKVLERLHLTGTENQIAQVEVGKTRPMTRGMNFAGPGRQVPTFTMENVGSILTATSRVSGDDLLIEIAVEKSWVPERPQPPSDDDGDSARTFRPDETQKFQIRSTVRVGKDQAVHIGGMTVSADGKQSRISAVVTAKAVR